MTVDRPACVLPGVRSTSLPHHAERTHSCPTGQDEEDLAILVRDRDGRLVAGISGLVWAGCCELQAMWVEERLRGRGLGRALMVAAEDEARRRGCGLVAFHAYDLLAKSLYERLGYEVVGVIEGWPAGSAARWYRKVL